MKRSRLFSRLLGLMLAISLIPSANAAEIKSFSDVPTSFWAHDAIMDMVDKGLFAGTSTPINGVGTFSPDSVMTRAQFIVVLTKYLYSEQLSSMQSYAGDTWYANHYRVALDNELLFPEELDNGNLQQACTRQEMAMMLTRAAKLARGETAKKLVHESRIADYASIDEYYRNYVIQAYSMGMIAGTDSNGTFSPLGVLNRAQAATVIYKLVEPTTRNPVYFGEVTSVTWPNGTSYEGALENSHEVDSDEADPLPKDSTEPKLQAGGYYREVDRDEDSYYKQNVVIGEDGKASCIITLYSRVSDWEGGRITGYCAFLSANLMWDNANQDYSVINKRGIEVCRLKILDNGIEISGLSFDVGNGFYPKAN